MPLRVAFYSLSSCMGCLFSIAAHIEDLFNVLGEDGISIEYYKCFREDSSDEYTPLTDVAFVEGVVVTREDEENLRNIRRRTKYLVALGTCAATGNTAYYAVEELKEKGIPIDAKPLSEIVYVDYEIRGCPAPFNEVVNILVKLSRGWVRIWQPDYTVCRECKLSGVACLLDEGKPCLGPLTMGGCGAPCPNNGVPCIGCRGLAQEAQVESYIKIIREKGIPLEVVIGRLKLAMGKHVKELLRKLEETYEHS